MKTPDDFFQPEKIDEQIEHLLQRPPAGNADAELMAYLRSSSAMDAAQEREALQRMWTRILAATPGQQPETEKGIITSMQERQTLRSNMPPRQQSGWRGRRLGILAAVLVLILLVGSATIVFRALRQGSTGPNVGAQPTATSSLPPTATPIPFQVTGIAMSVSPSSLAGLTCGTHLTVQYKAVFHVAPQSQGGTVQFSYTVNNGRSQTPASLTFQPGESTKSYTFSWSGALPADHTYPGQGGVAVTSPNQVISPTVAPRGSCVAQSAFTVLGVQMAVSPASLAGRACGTALSVTYTATFHVAANSPGGTIQFEYTVNNGRSSAAASLKFVPGETSKSYTFTWSGNLPVDHTYPEQGGVIVTSPNAVNSSLLGPTGQCS